MQTGDLSRRGFVKQSALVAAATLSLPAAGDAAHNASLKVVCIGAHPDDPESGCGGTLARYAALGHAVTIVYLTRGERGIDGKSLDEAARIRTAESETACRIIGAKPVFFMSPTVVDCIVARAAVKSAAFFDVAALPKASL